MNKDRKLIFNYFPAFSFTLAYFVFLYLITGISRTVSPLQAVRSLFFFFFFLAICGFLINRLLKDHTKSGLVLWLIAELFLFSQAFFLFSVISTIVVLICWGAIILLRKKKMALSHISFLISVLGFGLMVLTMVLKQVPLRLYLSETPQIVEQPKSGLIVPESPPDIYYIVLDAYARTDILEDLFGFDNSDFVDYLQKKGFIVPTNNHSNYARSELSEAATLNMQYVQEQILNIEGWPHWWLLSPLIENSHVKLELNEIGYKSIGIAVDFENIDDTHVDIYYYPLPIKLNSFEKYLIQNSPISMLSPIIEKFTLINTYASHRKLIDYSFDTLSEIPNLDGSKFVYSHITSPHPPFVFDENGHSVEPSYNYSFSDGNGFPESKEEYIYGYISQLQYINQRLEGVIDSLLEQSETPPIIIVMSDHGSRLYTDFSDFENTCVSEGFSNFMALYLPGMESEDIPSDISSVNVFRIIFDNYFSTELGLLENKYFHSSNEEVFYQFREVSSEIDLECKISQ